MLWQHQLIVGLIVTFVPSVIVSALVLRFANLEPCKESALGHYIQRFFDSPIITALRLGGLLVMCVGAWQHIFWLIPAGLALVILAWARGLVFPKQLEKDF